MWKRRVAPQLESEDEDWILVENQENMEYEYSETRQEEEEEAGYEFCFEDAASDSDSDSDDDDDDDDDAFTDGLLDLALDNEQGPKRSDNIVLDPIQWSWQEYVASVGTSARLELHELKMMRFRGYGPEPAPFLPDADCFNPLFESIWLPWAINAQYLHNADMGLFNSNAGMSGLQLCTAAEQHYMSSAVPTRTVLEYMLDHAPNKRIAQIGTSSSYWGCLLEHLGANIIIVSDVFSPEARLIPRMTRIGEEEFFKYNKVNGRALFFLQPTSERLSRLAKRCLCGFPGNVVFFVGESGEDSAGSFDMAQWVEQHASEGWRVEMELEIPCWPASQNVFLCCVKGDSLSTPA